MDSDENFFYCAQAGCASRSPACAVFTAERGLPIEQQQPSGVSQLGCTGQDSGWLYRTHWWRRGCGLAHRYESFLDFQFGVCSCSSCKCDAFLVRLRDAPEICVELTTRWIFNVVYVRTISQLEHGFADVHKSINQWTMFAWTQQATVGALVKEPSEVFFIAFFCNNWWLYFVDTSAYVELGLCAETSGGTGMKSGSINKATREKLRRERLNERYVCRNLGEPGRVIWFRLRKPVSTRNGLTIAASSINFCSDFCVEIMWSTWL